MKKEGGGGGGGGGCKRQQGFPSGEHKNIISYLIYFRDSFLVLSP